MDSGPRYERVDYQGDGEPGAGFQPVAGKTTPMHDGPGGQEDRPVEPGRGFSEEEGTGARDTGPLFERPDYQPEDALAGRPPATEPGPEPPPPPPPGYRADAPLPPPLPPSPSSTDAAGLDDVLERIRRLSKK